MKLNPIPTPALLPALLLAFATTLPAAGQCATIGACTEVRSTHCWKVLSQQCWATPHSARFLYGPATTSPGPSIDCDACDLEKECGVIHIEVGQETGRSFCIGLGSQVRLGASAGLCGIGLTAQVTVSGSLDYCVDTKRMVTHIVDCKCNAGTLVHCRTITEIVPVTVALPVDYSMTTCYERIPGQRCQELADGTSGFTQTVWCGRVVKRTTDTQIRIRAQFQTGRCLTPAARPASVTPLRPG